jgi:hypothetical protein
MDLFEVGSFDQKSMNKPVWTCSKWIPTRRRRATTTTTRTPTASIRQRTRPSGNRRFSAEKKHMNALPNFLVSQTFHNIFLLVQLTLVLCFGDPFKIIGD